MSAFLEESFLNSCTKTWLWAKNTNVKLQTFGSKFLVEWWSLFVSPIFVLVVLAIKGCKDAIMQNTVYGSTVFVIYLVVGGKKLHSMQFFLN